MLIIVLQMSACIIGTLLIEHLLKSKKRKSFEYFKAVKLPKKTYKFRVVCFKHGSPEIEGKYSSDVGDSVKYLNTMNLAGYSYFRVECEILENRSKVFTYSKISHYSDTYDYLIDNLTPLKMYKVQFAYCATIVKTGTKDLFNAICGDTVRKGSPVTITEINMSKLELNNLDLPIYCKGWAKEDELRGGKLNDML